MRFPQRRRCAFPPGKGGGKGVARGGKGKGILIHALTEGNGFPLSVCTTGTNGDERQQVLPLLDKLKVSTPGPGRPKKRLKVLAGDKGYDAKWLRAALRRRGNRGQMPKRRYKNKRKKGRPIKVSEPRFQQERCFAWLQRKYRRLVVRWERLPQCFDAFLDLAVIHLWVSKIILVG
ncbi:MAG: transposase [Cyanobacteria bacterium P01_H01_bin.15]